MTSPTSVQTRDTADSFSLQAIGEDRIRITRRFVAAPRKVWLALTEPALLRRWMGGPDAPLLECEIDLRPGGAHRYVWEGMSLSGTIREVTPPSGVQPGRMVHTELFEPNWTDGETVCITTIAPDGSGTLLTMETVYPNQASRDMAIEAGMEETMRASYATLDPLSETI